ncbi:hypothetical protein LguiB_000157 [Lonicera macranthoides]
MGLRIQTLKILAVFSLNNGSSLNELCAVIRTKFNELSSADFTVKYVLPESEPCVLLRNEDMGFMFAFIPLVMEEHVHSDPSFTAKEVLRNMKREYGISVPYWNAWYAKEMALREVHGDDDMSYRFLVRYLKLLEQTNAGTRCSFEVEPELFRFNRDFIALGSCIKGFLRCRPILCLDATFVKSKFKGTLMAATSMNGDLGTFLIATLVGYVG